MFVYIGDICIQHVRVIFVCHVIYQDLHKCS